MPPPPSPAPSVRLRVLIVDDEPEVGKAIRRMLSTEHEVTVTRSGVDARRLLDEQTFDAIVCDLMMPDLSGMELLRRSSLKPSPSWHGVSCS